MGSWFSVIGAETMISQKILLPTVFKLKVSTFGLELITHGINTLKIKIGLFALEEVFRERGVATNPCPPTWYMKKNLSIWRLKMTLCDIFSWFKLQIPLKYVQGLLWTKLAPAWPPLGVYISNWGQLDNMQQLLFKVSTQFYTLPHYFCCASKLFHLPHIFQDSKCK